MNITNPELIVTDLDGTLLQDNQVISKKDIETLQYLKHKNIYRVIATGRSVFSAKKVLDDDFPIDYLIFSSGAGILNWKTKKLIFSENLIKEKIKTISDILISEQIDFMIHYPIPDNHKFRYYKTNKKNIDFDNRCKLYKDYASALDINNFGFEKSCQIIAIFNNNISEFERIKEKISSEVSDIKIIRATSPLNGKSIWMEIFSDKVSKAKAAKYLCKILNINTENTLGIGNDYNDLDLLHWASQSFVVANAPEELKNKFKNTETNSNNGFTKAVMHILNQDKI
ncbi:MAG: HAD-IIB family hydrolase [Bacteroidales bacterium]|nr:HAD-IIB family hydrolase [Bacteroidales bacterium]